MGDGLVSTISGLAGRGSAITGQACSQTLLSSCPGMPEFVAACHCHNMTHCWEMFPFVLCVFVH